MTAQTNPTPDALVERLRRKVVVAREKGVIKRLRNPDGPEAASILTAMQERIERLERALNLAANRLQRCSVDYDTGTRQFIEVGEWAEEARTALGRGE